MCVFMLACVCVCVCVCVYVCVCVCGGRVGAINTTCLPYKKRLRGRLAVGEEDIN